MHTLVSVADQLEKSGLVVDKQHHRVIGMSGYLSLSIDY